MICKPSNKCWQNSPLPPFWSPRETERRTDDILGLSIGANDTQPYGLSQAQGSIGMGNGRMGKAEAARVIEPAACCGAFTPHFSARIAHDHGNIAQNQRRDARLVRCRLPSPLPRSRMY